MIRYIGLDVHRKSVRACALQSDNCIAFEQDLECTREHLVAFAKAWLTNQDVVALESTFHSWAIADVLAPFVSKVVVSNPLATKVIAQSKVKTDKVDARVLSQLLRIDYLPEVWTPDSATRELRGLCARRATLVSDMVRIKNRIHGVLAKALIPRPKGELFDRKGQAFLLAQDLPKYPAAQLRSDLRLLEVTRQELEEHDRILVQNAWADPRVKLLITMPGVDVTVALAILAALGDIQRFKDGNHVAAYLGLVPSISQSGERCYHGHITKRGNGKARWLLIQAAQHLSVHPGPLGVFFRRLARRKNRNVAVVATARKLACIAWCMLKDNEPYRYAQPRPTQDKLARLRIRATGARRKGGNPKGAGRHPNYGSGKAQRTIPSLPTIFNTEGIPVAPSEDKLKPAEARMLKDCSCWGFFQSTQQSNVIQRKSSATMEET